MKEKTGVFQEVVVPLVAVAIEQPFGCLLALFSVGIVGCGGLAVVAGVWRFGVWIFTEVWQ